MRTPRPGTCDRLTRLKRSTARTLVPLHASPAWCPPAPVRTCTVAPARGGTGAVRAASQCRPARRKYTPVLHDNDPAQSAPALVSSRPSAPSGTRFPPFPALLLLALPLTSLTDCPESPSRWPRLTDDNFAPTSPAAPRSPASTTRRLQPNHSQRRAPRPRLFLPETPDTEPAEADQEPGICSPSRRSTSEPTNPSHPSSLRYPAPPVTAPSSSPQPQHQHQGVARNARHVFDGSHSPLFTGSFHSLHPPHFGLFWTFWAASCSTV
ncbi:uncharacterized protein TrAtP1_012706 [Trichoderma atroviride]|uniref:uncharacterized protein n=1 Tax=Hypocrea atroviridis TaxID=63577 RepID=UPI0033349DDC|nr:hypothetical protein TrAtP1_012706 [Trichoderma atroviride]